MNYLSRAIYFSLFFCFYPLLAKEANAQSVVINEITWMGNKNSYNDEWIELYNNSDSQINLQGWRLTAQDGTPEINLTASIPAFGFYLLERTDDNTVPNISADQIYTGALENNGEDLALYDNNGNLTERINCSSGWFGGDNSTKQTMERKNPQGIGTNQANWATSQNPGGTPKTKNSLTAETPSPQKESLEQKPIESPVIESPAKEEQSQVELEKPEPKIEPEKESMPLLEKISYPSGIIINEILPSPRGSDETEEWIELFNQNQFEVDLSGWKIKDSAGAITTFTIPLETKIPALGFMSFFRPDTKITLNNDGDEISLLLPDSKTVETISYQKAKLGQSYSRFDLEWFWTDRLTPGAKNIITESVSQNTKTQIPEKTAEENKDSFAKKELSAIGEQVTKKNLFVLLIALAIAILSSITILILKRNLNPVRKQEF